MVYANTFIDHSTLGGVAPALATIAPRKNVFRVGAPQRGNGRDGSIK